MGLGWCYHWSAGCFASYSGGSIHVPGSLLWTYYYLYFSELPLSTMTLFGLFKDGELEEKDYFCPLNRELFDMCTADLVRETSSLNRHCLIWIHMRTVWPQTWTNAREFVAEACLLPHQLLCIQMMFWKTCLFHCLLPPSFFFALSLPPSCLRSCTSCRITLNIELTFFQGITKRKVENHVNRLHGRDKRQGGLVIHLFYSLLRVVLKDLPTLSAQAYS